METLAYLLGPSPRMGQMWNWQNRGQFFVYQGMRIGPKSEWLNAKIWYNLVEGGMLVRLEDNWRSVAIVTNIDGEITTLEALHKIKSFSEASSHDPVPRWYGS